MRRAFLVLIIFLFAILEATFLNLFRIFRIAPDLLLIVVVTVALYDEFGWAVFYAVIAGMLKDLFSGGEAVMYVLFFPLWVYFIRKLSRKIFIENNIVRMAIMFGVSLLNNVAVILFVLFAGHSLTTASILTLIFIGPLYTAIVFPLVCRFFDTQLYRQIHTV